MSPRPYEGVGWQHRALCRETSPEIFFPHQGGRADDAKRICGQCEVRAACLNHALTNRERHGVWGGMSEDEREELARRRRRAAS